MDNELITLRRELHANPELSGQEYKTSAKLAQFLSQYMHGMHFFTDIHLWSKIQAVICQL